MQSKSLVLAGAISMALVSVASAAVDQYVYLTGSTAARGNVFNTLSTVAAGSVFDAAPAIVTQGNATPSKSAFMMFTGHLRGSTPGLVTAVKCHWSGSEAGVADVAGSGTETFLADGATTSSGSPGPTVSSTVDLAMVDNDKAFSKNPGAAITGAKVGVITFKWVKEKGSLAGITGVTDSQLRVLLSGGSPAALLTGNNADTDYVYISGRNSNSGTRVNTYGITGYGIFSSANQIQIAADGSMIDQGGGSYIGDYGYESGGDVATQMGYDLSVGTSQDLVTGSLSHFSVLGYLGFNDAGTAVSNGGTELTYNGVTFSAAAVKEGKYGFWGNEYIYRKNTVSSQAQAVFGFLANATTGIGSQADGNNLIKLGDMNASRNGPTSDPVHN